MILTSPSESQKIAISKSDLLSGDFFYMNGNNWNYDFGSLTLSTCPAKLKILRIFVKKYSTSKKMVNILILMENLEKGFNLRDSLKFQFHKKLYLWLLDNHGLRRMYEEINPPVRSD